MSVERTNEPRKAWRMRIGLCCVAVLAWVQCADAQIPISFADDIAPIFDRHCVSCHGPDRVEGELRLDSPAGLREGSETGLPFLGVPREKNEIYQRIISDEASYRMPYDRPPLDAADIDRIGRWIDQGTPLGPDLGPLTLAPAQNSTGAQNFTGYITNNPALFYLLIAFAAANAGIVWVERRKRLIEGIEDAKAPYAFVRAIGPWQYAVVWLVFALLFGGAWHMIQMQSAREEIAAMAAAAEAAPAYARKSLTTEEIYGTPPIPLRMHHPKGLSRLYYRGNDERSEKLFNGGNYRTADITISLIDAKGNKLDYGDEVPADGIFFEFDAKRAPHSAKAFFSDRVLSGVMVTEAYPPSEASRDPDATSLEITEPEERCRAQYPIRLPEGDGRTGLRVIYLMFNIQFRYGLCYDLVIEDGRIAEDSEIWLGNLCSSPRLIPPSNAVPQREWLDWQPIPVLDEPVIDDPYLTGIGEYIDISEE